MTIRPAFGLILIGLSGLIVGGELLVRVAYRLAVAARIIPLVIDITVVSFGTSAPELAVTAFVVPLTLLAIAFSV